MAVIKIVPMPGPQGPQGPAGTGDGGLADIADFTFTNNGDYTLEGEVNAESEISLHNKDFSITTTRDQLTEEQINEFGNIDADINLTAADDIFIRAEGDDVNISASNDVVINSNDSELGHTWEFNSDGHFYLPNGTDILDASEIVGVPETRQLIATADYLGNTPTNNSTGIYLTLDQDSSWMIDNFSNKVTSTITFGDSSTVDIIAIYVGDVGGTAVAVFQWDISSDVFWPITIDQTSNISNNTKSLTLTVPDDIQASSWTFSSDGSFSFPNGSVIETQMDAGHLVISTAPSSINNGGNIELNAGYTLGENKSGGSVSIAAGAAGAGSAGGSVYISTSDTGRILLAGDGGEFLNNMNIPENQIATLGDIGIETDFVVAGGTDGTQPTFTGDPLFSGSYVKMSSNLVHFQIQVDMDNITSFGTGQYYVDLPFPAKYGYKFREGCLHDISTGRDYAIGGHVFAGESRITLTSTDTQSGAVFDIPFTGTAPITLNVADNFHIAGTYISQ